MLSSPGDWRARRLSQGIVYEDAAGGLELPEPVLAGEHQIDNSAAAIATLRALGWNAVDARAIAAGLRSAKWPARLQHVVDGPYVKLLPEGWELWLDGGHNPAAGAVDSRAFGVVPSSLIEGRVLLRYRRARQPGR